MIDAQEDKEATDSFNKRNEHGLPLRAWSNIHKGNE
jgi:hypothetical protein